MNHHQKEVVIMKKTAAVSLFLVLALVLALCLPAAVAEEAGFLGKPFPDFTVTDTEGNTFTLSEQLKDHDAVLINFWATWCNPCKTEFPYLQEAQEKYDDRVAFIALSAFSGDSMETIAAYRQENSFTIPMGLDAGSELYDCTGTTVYPVTVIVDRFGNAVFCHTGSFMNAAEIDRVLDCFTGEDYAESAVLEEIPADLATRAYPVSAKRAVYVDNDDVKTISIHVEGVDEPYTCYLVPEEKAHLRFEITAADNPEAMAYVDSWGPTLLVSDLFDSERNAYVYDQPTEALYNGMYYHYNVGMLADFELASQDPDRIRLLLIRDEANMEEVVEILRQSGHQGEITWEYAKPEKEGRLSANSDRTYTVYVLDQNRDPVPEVYLNFCTDTACVSAESDENGVIVFDGAPDVYHLQIVEVPDGYSYDESFELYTDRTYGDWMLWIRKD